MGWLPCEEKDKRTEFLTLLSPFVTVCTFTGSCACMVQQMSRPLRAFRSAPRPDHDQTPFKMSRRSRECFAVWINTTRNPQCSATQRAFEKKCACGGFRIA